MDRCSVSSESLGNPQIAFDGSLLELVVGAESQAAKIVLVNPEYSVIKHQLAIEKTEEAVKEREVSSNSHTSTNCSYAWIAANTLLLQLRVTERELEVKDISERRANDVACREVLLTARESEIQVAKEDIAAREVSYSDSLKLFEQSLPHCSYRW
jgi:hypothetical protein